MSVDISDGPEMPKIGNLNLSTVRAEREAANKFGLSGDHELATGDIPMSPRAQSDAVLMTPRTAMGKKDTKRAQFTSAEDLHGEGPVAIASNGEVHASIGVNGKLALWDAVNSKLLCQVTLQLPSDLAKKQETKRMQELKAKPPKWLAFDCVGLSLGIHRPGVGLWLCKVKKEGSKMEVTDALMLGDGKMSEHFTWTGFSSTVSEIKKNAAHTIKHAPPRTPTSPHPCLPSCRSPAYSPSAPTAAVSCSSTRRPTN